jgi:hypothetical protein
VHITIAILAILLVNLFFGYWRSNTRKFSWPWIGAIHIPVPIAIGIRFLLLGWSWPLIPAFVAVYAAGQFLGGKIRKLFSRQPDITLSSWLGGDLYKLVKNR